ncbi:pentatricopeptide repeat-containing protein [Tanacetum coccineum]
MKKLLKYNEMDLFWMVCERMIEANMTFNCILYNNVIDGYFKIGKTEEAKRVFLEMKEKDCSPDLVTYNLIIGGLLEQGEVDEGLCKLGEFKDAIKLLGGMKDDGVLSDANCYYPIIRDLVRQKELRKFGI